jgi:probable HAF family extracellular repeat protein
MEIAQPEPQHRAKRVPALFAFVLLASFAAGAPPKAGFYVVDSFPLLEDATEVCGISADGGTVLGYAQGAAGRRGIKWTSKGTAKLGDVSWTTFRAAGGQTVFDDEGNPSELLDVKGDQLRWARSVAVLGAPSLPLGPFSTMWVFCASADDKVFAGNGAGKQGTEAFRCAKGGAPKGLGDLPGGFFYSQANGISADGGAVVGMSRSFDGPQAFLWTASKGMVGLGMLPGKCQSTEGLCASKNGTMVGGCGLTENGLVACVWAMGGTAKALDKYLAEKKISVPTGWKLEEAQCISDDGTVIAGNGVNPAGKRRGWVVVLGSPVAAKRK